MSPAKMFAYMKERENKLEQQDVQKVSSSTRDLFGGKNPEKCILCCVCMQASFYIVCYHLFS